MATLLASAKTQSEDLLGSMCSLNNVAWYEIAGFTPILFDKNSHKLKPLSAKMPLASLQFEKNSIFVFRIYLKHDVI
ncbi:hypothetical protein NECAME_14182 [Necator americanus]|uniref:Uncharacterized protein n=1 Tax=Necator americanus TaxID=51031 RepID=W2SPT0_NECAM|nr:hypothetical protein NECAME_14182 [Necator americanus]ETN71533.1 hypothetical protein NECAME_14182 [Necator americanus]